MKILIVGAGAVGSYFGARLQEKGEDVTFLVREKKKEILDQKGLVIESVHGDIQCKPTTIRAGMNPEPYDVIILTTKAYHIHDAITDIKPYVGESTMILPLLNGISHVNLLTNSFSDHNVIGGLCFIESTLAPNGHTVQSSPIHELVFGERSGEKTTRILQLQKAFSDTKAEFRLSENIEQDMWQKYLFITTLSGVTSLFRSPIGPILTSEHGTETIKQVLFETATIMRNLHAPILSDIEKIQFDKIKQMDFTMKSSLQRDMEKTQAIEADHLYGYLIEAAKQHSIDTPILSMIYANLKIYESIIS
ncbi:ketopantoate reductase family protein [Aquibacillus saliphilus]|uniref:ketopantoate reductase family protein n=1 Tax=Aquibacillus saliphilus TaxID=1909422 RepID=UPI001CF0D26A|nr:ketopantoate reductase family protein [Aquibacillus saliphilus]